MTTQNFVDGQPPLISAAWLNQIDVFVNTLFGAATTPTQALTALGMSAYFQTLIGLGSGGAILSAIGGASTSGNNSWTGTQTFFDNKFQWENAADNTKKALVSLTAISTGQTRTINVPDTDSLIPTSTAAAARVWAGPASGAAAAPTFRALQPSDLGITSLTNSLNADVNLNVAGTYFDGPSVAQGTSGTWLATGTIVILSQTGTTHNIKLWDGTTVIASASIVPVNSTNQVCTIALSGVITSPAGNLRISATQLTAASSVMKFNQSGNSKDSTITAVRIG